jgi:hypothetical protein
MQALRRPFLMLVILVLTSLSPLLTAQSEPQDLQESEPTFMSEQQRLELASSMWHLATPSERFVTSLQPTTGELHMNIGSFDPLFDDHPPTPLGLYDANDFTTTGLALVQLYAHDGTGARQIGRTPRDYTPRLHWRRRMAGPSFGTAK